MSQKPITTLAVATALSFASISQAAFSEPDSPQKPCSYNGLIELNQQIYYTGDRLQINLVIPEQLKAVLRNEAQAHLAIHFPDGGVEAYPVVEEGSFLEATVEAEALAAGDYQLALVFTEPDGDALVLADWYNGFAGLVSFNHLKLSEADPGTDAQDIDGDGHYDIKSAAASPKELVEAAGTVTICADSEALTVTDQTATSTVRSTAALEGVLEPAIDEAVGMLVGLQTLAEEYYDSMGELPSLETIGWKISGRYVANLNQQPLSYQATLKSEGVDNAIAGKTIQISYNPSTYTWTCGPGSVNGIEHQYLPNTCR